MDVSVSPIHRGCPSLPLPSRRDVNGTVRGQAPASRGEPCGLAHGRRILNTYRIHVLPNVTKNNASTSQPTKPSTIAR